MAIEVLSVHRTDLLTETELRVELKSSFFDSKFYWLTINNQGEYREDGFSVRKDIVQLIKDFHNENN